PALRDPISASYLPLRAALGDNSSDNKTSLRHPPTVPARQFPCPKTRHSQAHDHHLAMIVRVFLCLETPHSYVLRLHTLSSTFVVSQDIGVVDRVQRTM